jgi:hypothetical protein
MRITVNENANIYPAISSFRVSEFQIVVCFFWQCLALPVDTNVAEEHAICMFDVDGVTACNNIVWLIILVQKCWLHPNNTTKLHSLVTL